MWDTLQVTHEGKFEVKMNRMNKLTHKYELLRMKPEEKIQDMENVLFIL